MRRLPAAAALTGHTACLVTTPPAGQRRADCRCSRQCGRVFPQAFLRVTPDQPDLRVPADVGETVTVTHKVDIARRSAIPLSQYVTAMAVSARTGKEADPGQPVRWSGRAVGEALTRTGLFGVACGLRIAQPAAGAEAEDGGEMERVGAAGEGFFDDPVVAELFGGDGQTTEEAGHPEPA